MNRPKSKATSSAPLLAIAQPGPTSRQPVLPNTKVICMSMANALARLRYQFVPDRQIGELLAKPWVDTAIPTLLLLLVIGGFGAVVPGFFSAGNLSDTFRQ